MTSKEHTRARTEVNLRHRLVLGFGLIVALAGCSQSPGDSLAVSRGMVTTEDAGPTDIIEVDTMLLPSDAAQAAKFGAQVAISGDILVAAAPSLNLDSAQTVGAVYVFVRNPATGQWVEQKKLVPRSGSEEWSLTVAISGNTVAIGTPFTDAGAGFQRGAVHIFERDQGGTDNWGEVATLSGADLGDLAQFGLSLALSGDLLVVGAPEPSSIGQLEIFERNRGGINAWGKITTLSYNDDAGLSPEYFGVSLAIDGDLLLVGATSADVSYYAANDGAAYLFQRDAVNRDLWTYVTRFTEPEATRCTGGRTISEMWAESAEVQEEWRLCAEGDTDTDNVHFGGNVAVRGDTAVVTGRGAAYVFQRDATNASRWPQVAKLENPDGSGFGKLALDDDTLLIGAAGTDVDARVDQGAVHVFERDPSTRAFIDVEMLIATTGASGDFFGNSLARDGTTRVIGASARGGDRGAVYVHETGALPPPPSECQPLFPCTDTLVDSGTVTSPSGFKIAALPGALTAPSPIWIQEVAPPDEPLLASSIAAGAYYSVGAECTTYSAPGAYFVVTLPVPPSANTARLGVAALVPASSMHDGHRSRSDWQPLLGSYDATLGSYSVAVAGLASEGVTFVLIEDPSFETLPPREPTSDERTFTQFPVGCFGLSAQACGPTQQRAAQHALVQALILYRLQGFPDPYLVGFKPAPLLAAVMPFPAFFVTSSKPSCNSGANLATYSALTGTIDFCVDPAGGPLSESQIRDYARHELFHAIQWAFPNVRNNPRNKWVIEGTASAAQAWDGGVMHRYPLRRVRGTYASLANEGTSTKSIEYPYEAQDFWVHLFRSTNAYGDRRSFPLGELVSFFDRGASTEAVADRMQNPANFSYVPLGEEYWAWVKNQVIERTDVDFDGALTNACTMSTLVGKLIPHTYVVPVDSPTVNDVDVRFYEGLESRVIAVTIPTALENMSFTVAGDAAISYKVYLQADPLVSDCRDGIDDGPRVFASLPAGATVHVLIANKAYGSAGRASRDAKLSIAKVSNQVP
jgi:hypothetical protein